MTTRSTAAERERRAHLVDLDILNRRGDVEESHRMESWDVSMRAGALLGAFRDAHGYSPDARVRFVANPARDGRFLLPPSWR